MNYAAKDALAKIIDDSALAYRVIAERMGGVVSHVRVGYIHNGEKSPVRLSEFLAICDVCNADPVQTLRDIIAEARRIELSAPPTRWPTASSPIPNSSTWPRTITRTRKTKPPHHANETAMKYDELLAEASHLGVKVRERELSPGRCGCYYAPGRLIIIDETLPDFARVARSSTSWCTPDTTIEAAAPPTVPRPRDEPGVKPRSDSSTRPNTQSPNACTRETRSSSPKRST